jgi:hypothetical protein
MFFYNQAYCENRSYPQILEENGDMVVIFYK